MVLVLLPACQFADSQYSSGVLSPALREHSRAHDRRKDLGLAARCILRGNRQPACAHLWADVLEWDVPARRCLSRRLGLRARVPADAPLLRDDLVNVTFRASRKAR